MSSKKKHHHQHQQKNKNEADVKVADSFDGGEAVATLEENKALYCRIIDEVANQGDIAAVDKYFAADVIEHEEFPGTGPGREGVKQFFIMLRRAFPDLRVVIEDLVAEGDRVVAREVWRGTHKGSFLGIAPTGKSISFQAVDIIRIADGKLAEHWGQTDSLALFQQLGVTPSA